MEDILTAALPLSPFTAPLLSEETRQRLTSELENYLLPLVEYCDRQEENEELSHAQFQHVQRIREALAALLRYDEQTEQLLEHYRVALQAGQQLAAAQVPSLEQALNPNPTPAELLAEREADPLYRLGYVRGQRAALPMALAPRPPAALAARIRGLLDQPHLQARATLPLEHRQALAGFTSYDLPHAPQL